MRLKVDSGLVYIGGQLVGNFFVVESEILVFHY